ncbi:helix-turn-helix domain-containing protein [Bogoriella caseilytica]|uniref:Helix-turn-helix protein n=1 Tax=Bogoriella caseilytica TaxID=56055 RepID=A0A3N2BAH9_9MICO|nr:helix-turn-helix domain-containing protein [Bogoriella caseilytica]ROR72276.1 helix-turn-helix protein [Bogoriella caseilytica]
MNHRDGAGPGTSGGGAHALSSAALKALSHPVRRRLLELLGAVEVARVSTLAEQVGSAPNSVSFHLRALEKAGLARRVPGQGDRRESYWEAVPGPAFLDHSGPEVAGFLHVQHQEQARRLAEAFRQAEAVLEVPQDERAEALKAEFLATTLTLTHDELTALLVELGEVLTRFGEQGRRKPETGRRTWDVSLFAVRDWDGTSAH